MGGLSHPPCISSKYSDENFYDNLASDILTYTSEDSNCIFIGDFNSRIGNLQDHVDIPAKYVELRGSTLGEQRYRNNLDFEINESGKKLIQFCKSFGLRILNGIKHGDILGDFTHFNANDGQSTVDLAFLSEDFFKNISKFMIFPQSELSDHCKIVVEIPNLIINKFKQSKYKWSNLKPAYKWDKNSAFKFKRAFEPKQIEQQVEEFYKIIKENNTEAISAKFYNILQNVCKNSLKKRKVIQTKKKQKNKDKLWYDRDCENKKNETKNCSKEKFSNPLDRELGEKFREKMKQYKLLCTQKRSMFWNAKIKELEENSSKNDTQFWNNWKQFSEDRIKNNIEIKDGNKWENYYKNLYSETQVKSLPPADIKEPNQILNRRITEKELK